MHSVEAVRAWFPALQSDWAFMDNAGGSQTPGIVADAVRDYMLTSFVQVGASYPASRRATETIEEARAMVSTLMGGDGIGTVLFGPSSSALCRMLSDCYAEVLQPGDEVVVAESGHEANVFPWIVLESRGVAVKVWKPDPETGLNRPEDLARLLTNRTRVVAFPQVSNILGALEKFEDCVHIAKSAGARVVLDSVAYSPHLAMDVQRWGVDWCVFSCYKVYGPHMGALFGTHEAVAELTGRNHPFISRDDVPTKFELGGVLHEGCAGLVALKRYFGWLARTGDGDFGRHTVEQAFNAIRVLEEPLTTKLIQFLKSKHRVRIIGPATHGPERVATVSFVHESVPTPEIVAKLEAAKIGMRYGHFYSLRLLEHLGRDPDQGVARISLAHYNSPQEVDRVIAALDSFL